VSVEIFWPRHSREELVALLRESLPALAAALPLRRVALFGSWASGRSTAFSDVDLLVVHAGPPREDAYALVQTLIPVRGLEPHIYSEAEAAASQATLEHMTRGAVELL
jgi:predicted nucleotidyltransferase